MDIAVKNFDDLDDLEIETWRALHQNDPALISPFYAPEFSRTVHQAGKQVHVGLVSDQNGIIGIFPFHRGPIGIGVPVGGQISDYQGVIGPCKANVSTADLLKVCGLQAYDFNHLPADQSALAKGQFSTAKSPYLNLENGFDFYYSERRSTKNKVLKNAVRNLRILERDIGTVRVELNDQSDEAWDTLVKWKNQSLQQMGVSSILDVPWARTVFENIRNIETEHFAGVVSSLYVGGNIIAIHFGMRSHAAFHWWFPTYDQNKGKYSPGLVLLLEVAKHLPEIGITRLDMGRGFQPYKKAFASGSTTLGEGSIENGLSLAGSTRKLRKSVDRTLSSIPAIAGPARLQRRVFNRLLGAVRLPN